MKSLAKALIPTSALNAVRGYQNRSALRALEMQEFDLSHLRASSNITPSALLENEALDTAWRRDHSAISKLLGDDNRWGGVNPGDRQAIYKLILALQPLHILEIGTHIGASSLYIASALKEIGEGHLTSVDLLDVNADDAPWKGLGLPHSPKMNAKLLDIDEKVRFVQSSSQAFLASTDKRFDLIFLDGDHGAATVYNELALALKILKPGGLILLHDYYPGGKALFPDKNVINGPYLALERARLESPGLHVHSLSPLPWPTKQGSCNTSLALVMKADV